MNNAELKNAGWKLVQDAADAKCFEATRRQSLLNTYVDNIRQHGDDINATLVQLIALNAIENA